MKSNICNIKKAFILSVTVIIAFCSFATAFGSNVLAAEKNVYSFMNDFPKTQGENGWRMYCGATESFFDKANNSWTNSDTHQIPSAFKNNVITTCNNGGVSYIDFIAPKSGSVSITFKAKIKAPANDGGDGTYGGGLFGIHLSDPKRTNPNEADKQSAEPVFPAGLESWFVSGRYELQDGETLNIQEFLDIDKGQIVQFCFCSKGDPWTFSLETFEVSYDDGTEDTQNTSSKPDSSNIPSNESDGNTSQNETSSQESVSSENTSVSDNSSESGATVSSENETGSENETTTGNSNDAILLDWNTDDDQPEEVSYTGLIIGLCIGGVALIGIIVAVFVICHIKGII